MISTMIKIEQIQDRVSDFYSFLRGTASQEQRRHYEGSVFGEKLG